MVKDRAEELLLEKAGIALMVIGLMINNKARANK